MIFGWFDMVKRLKDCLIVHGLSIFTKTLKVNGFGKGSTLWIGKPADWIFGKKLHYCSSGRIKGAVKVSTLWLIPQEAEKPADKRMNLMFSYPIKRQKILISQMLAVWIFNFMALVLTKILIYGCVLAGSHFMTSAFPLDFNMASLSFYVQLILKSVVIVSMSFIALFIGLAMKSSKATIISSFLLIFLTQANIGDFTMKNNLVFPVILTLISLVFAVLSVYNAETKDLM